MKSRIFLLTLLLGSIFTFSACSASPENEPPEKSSDTQIESTDTEEVLYETAVLDAMIAEEDEVQSLVTLTPEDDMTTWNDSEKVLLLTWHSYPDSYISGESTVLEFGDVWTFTDKEIANWYADNHEDVSDWEQRFEQLIGLPASDEKTHFTAFWVNPQDTMRPAYNSDVTSNSMYSDYPEDMDETYKSWFDSNIISSYFEGDMYPWTRLGYTYDWADNGTDYGLTEFLVMKDSQVDVEFTKTTDEFIDYLSEITN